ncbi:hypothetical protein GCM10008934_10270 [Virgibacillus salarius]|uniref:glycosyltransferase family 2 protein n=1 Tax=Virgibacillus salarius TaxID=447199 RepID=UPI0031D82767
MNIKSDYTKRINYIKDKKENLINTMQKETEVLNYLKRSDSSWSFFIRNNMSFNKNSINNELSASEYLKLKKSKSDTMFIEKFKEKLNKIPQSNGSAYYEKLNVNVGTICDIHFYNTFKDTVNLKVIGINNNKDQLRNLDILIVSNMSNELCGQWSKFSLEENRTLSILEIIKCFRGLGKPVIFYDQSKVANDHNLILAREADKVYTTTNNKARYYNNNDIYHVETNSYTINPLLYNPIVASNQSKIQGVLYNGMWSNDNTLEEMIDGVINSEKELKIIDTKYYDVSSGHNYPVNYFQYISPANSDYEHSIHKMFNYSLVHNDIEKIYQLQALGNVVLSNYHPEINNKFPNVFTVDSHFEVSSILDHQSELSMYKIQIEGIRNIMSSRLSYEKMESVLNSAGISCSFKQKRVLVVGDTYECEEQFERQSFKYGQFIHESMLDENILGDFDYITFFTDGYFYEEYYLEDLLNGFKYTNSDFVAKDNNGKRSFNYTNEVIDLYRTMFNLQSFSNEQIINKSFYDNEYNGFYIDHLEVQDRKNKQTQSSTVGDKELSVIVPIYNNGKFLEYKCFESLKRSSIFNKMEILFIDDGSTDPETIHIVNRLHRNYDNVNLYRFSDYGSGSASRPRNKGIELSTCDYITYLDPDNEAINDGYAKLLREIKSNRELDIVVGNISRYDSSLKRREINYYYTANKILNFDLVQNPTELLKQTNLKVQSIQALIAKKSLIKDNNLKMVESAAGQDTLFFQELLTKANQMKVVDLNIHVYYAAVDNSVTNTVSSKFYEKYYKVEKERIKFLESNELFDIYISNKYQSYFVNWYLKKLIDVKKGEEKKSLIILDKIYKIYEPYITDEHELLKTFKKYFEREKYEEYVLYCRDYFKRNANKNRISKKSKKQYV